MRDRINSDVVQSDIYEPEYIEISIRKDGAVVWVNVDGVCRTRVMRPKKIIITDDRRV